MIYIVGLGPGHKEYILPKAIKIINDSEIVIGFKRALDSLNIDNDKKVYMSKLSDLDEYIINENDKRIISIIASGDPLFYGISNYINNKAKVKVQIIPGISSFQYLTCKVNLPWNNAYVGSMHGRNEEFLETVKKTELSIWLTDRQNNPRALCEVLKNENINCRVIIGENLSYDDEKIRYGTPEEFLNYDFSNLSIFIVDKSNKK